MHTLCVLLVLQVSQFFCELNFSIWVLNYVCLNFVSIFIRGSLILRSKVQIRFLSTSIGNDQWFAPCKFLLRFCRFYCLYSLKLKLMNYAISCLNRRKEHQTTVCYGKDFKNLRNMEYFVWRERWTEKTRDNSNP